MDQKLYINPPLVNRAYDWKNGPQPKTRKELDKFFNSKPIQAVKEQICEMGRRIYNKGYTDGNGGNLSVRVGEDLVLRGNGWRGALSERYMEAQAGPDGDGAGHLNCGMKRPVGLRKY